MTEQMQRFEFKTMRNVFPPLEKTVDRGYVESTDPMAALEEIVRSYHNQSSLFSVEIMEKTPEQRVVARYLSAKATGTQEASYELVK